ncbi:MAG: phenylalanine--tRNA ligase subunit alpha [Candidatus Njordarchaeales archaeon]
MHEISELINMLTESERKLLAFLRENNLSQAYEDSIAEALKTDIAEISRAALWLENKGILKRVKEEIEIITISDKGKKYLTKPLPEQQLLGFLKKRRSVKFDEALQELSMDLKELNAAVGKLIRAGLLRLLKKDSERYLQITEKGLTIEELPTSTLFREIAKKGTVFFSEIDSKNRALKELLYRGIVTKKKLSRIKLQLTDLGREIIKHEIPPIEIIDTLSPEIIVSKEWMRKKIRWYDVSSKVPRIWGGRKHPLREIMEMIREIFLEMGFMEMRGPWVELAFWNMDSMWIPQDHPAREMQATFYLEVPKRGFVRDEALLAIVKEVQETGGDTGSTGWQQPWRIDEALKTLLRTHTTAVTFRVLGFLLRRKIIEPPVKFFCIDRVFRNETIDWKHLAEFHQVEGFVAAKNLTLKSLMGYIKEFYRKMGIEKIRFKPTYNPYTEPSMEIFALHPKVKKWIEVGNSGLFRPESLRPYNIDVPIIAWGLAVERLAAIIYDIEDIRKLVGPMCDIDWIRWHRTPIGKLF